ncbi:MAG: U32 family peptidase [Clostridia bacterium]|nr:U32 family peptidase [Clostridia bacterium]
MLRPNALPELLAPAGSPIALRAAIEGGADAVYFGGPAFNARLRAANFTAEELRESIALCHAHGVRAYITMNTLVTDRELPALLDAAYAAATAGADALIVADLGAAAMLRRHLPEVELHASTQMSAHSIAAAKELAALGFTRVVLARETPAPDVRRFVAEGGVETELFVHGALCVSHSGQCLFSSLVGGRSGNRGACAQPCRLPDAKGRYPLSLKDLSLARHVPALIEMGVDSLKIEGRLKAPEYVREVVATFRRLLDERRAATDGEMKALESVFSRGGFTDAYFTERISHRMLGVRSESNKRESRALAPFTDLTRRVPLDLSLTMRRGAPLSLTARVNDRTVTVTGEPPLVAERAPMDRAAVEKNLCRLGGTPYEAHTVQIDLDEGLMVPVSRLNALRRAALEALTAPALATLEKPTYVPIRAEKSAEMRPTARFAHAAQIPACAHDFFAHIYLPLAEYDGSTDGVELPPVILDHEQEGVRKALTEAAAKGAKHALVGNLGHLALAREAGLVPHGDFRLNVQNRETLAALLTLGFADILLSPELTLPQIRDMRGARDAIVYGRIPLMLLEKCAAREVGDCTACNSGYNTLTDRRGEKFPILRVAPHRNILVNSRPTVMSDRLSQLRGAGLTGGHFLFTVESADEAAHVIEAYQNGTPLAGAMRRI